MDVQFLAHLLNPLLMIVMPLALAFYLTHRFKLGWRLWWIGAAIFVLSQVGHIPFNALVGPIFNSAAVTALPENVQIVLKAVFLGLSAGLFEELFRYGMFRWWARDARSWSKGLLAGAGHGGAEAILLGVISLYTFIQLAALRNMDLSKVFPANQLVLAEQQVHGFWSMGSGMALLGALERFFTIPIQISLAVLVLQAFTRKKWYWVWVAVLYHALIDTTAVLVPAYIGILWVEAFVGFFSIVSIGIIFLLRQPEPPEPTLTGPAGSHPEFIMKPVEESKDNLDNTIYD